MLSYRHSYHAGNFADLLKHLSQFYILSYLNRKDKPWCYLDTHSGAGLYSLHSEQATKTSEFQQGIQRLFEQELQHPLLQQYKALVASFNKASRLDFYPGSPAIAAQLARPTDRLQLHELHPSDYPILARHFAEDRRVKVSESDGFAGLKASLPPRERRGLILIDPSYEIKEDYNKVLQAVTDGLQRFATGTYAIWYPVLQRQQTESWIKRFRDAGIPDLLRIEHCPIPDNSGFGMTGSGMLVINPPYSMADDFRTLLPELNRLLRQGSEGHFRLDKLS